MIPGSMQLVGNVPRPIVGGGLLSISISNDACAVAGVVLPAIGPPGRSRMVYAGHQTEWLNCLIEDAVISLEAGENRPLRAGD